MRYLFSTAVSKTTQSIARGSGATIQIQGDRLIKRQSPKHSRLERERTEFGAQIAYESGLFEVPEILSYDDSEGEIVFRYVRDAVTLRDHLVVKSDPEFMERVGRILATIHNSKPACKASDVFWHGDYGVGNVLYSEDRDRITIIDWANAKWTLEPAERSSGSAGLDLGVALLSLFHHRLLGPMYIPKPEALGSAFIEAYKRERNCFSLTSVFPFIYRLIRRRRYRLIRRRRRDWILHRGILRNVAYDPSLIRLRLFLSRIHSKLQ